MTGRPLPFARLAFAVIASAVLATACVGESTVGDRSTSAGYREGRVQSSTGASDTRGGASWGGKGRAGEHKLYTRMK